MQRRTRQQPTKLRRERRARGVKVGPLASRVGIAVQTLYNAESGSGTLSVEVLTRIASELTEIGKERGLPAVSVDDLLSTSFADGSPEAPESVTSLMAGGGAAR